MLPEDVLLDIFDCYVTEASKWGWPTLVHVCQKWRYVVFRSPLRLNLRIACSAGTPVREKLAIWPPLPIIIEENGGLYSSKYHEDNIIAALGHNDRVDEIGLEVPSSLLDSVFAAMQKTFVALKRLWLYNVSDRAPVVPNSFLGGSAPHLQHLSLIRIQFPSPLLRNLLLSAPNLVTLKLFDIPHSGYFSPEAMVACLSVLTRLEYLRIGFQSPRSCPPREGRHPPSTRTVLPALIKLTFTGISEYLEDLVARIDAPLLNHLSVTFFHQLIFDTPQLVQFISRTPKLKSYDEARVIFSYSRATIALTGRNYMKLQFGISCRRSDWQLSSLAQICASSLIGLIPEHFYILEDVYSQPLWQDDLENNQWLEFFHPFTTVKNLYLSREFVPCVVPTLHELVGERVTEVLPNLQSIFLEGPEEPGLAPEHEAMRKFIAARKLSNRPVDISYRKGQNNWWRHIFNDW